MSRRRMSIISRRRGSSFDSFNSGYSEPSVDSIYYDDDYYDRMNNLDNESDNNYGNSTTIFSKSKTSKYNHSLDTIHINPSIRNLHVSSEFYITSNNEDNKENENNKEDLDLSLMKEFNKDLNIVHLNYFIESEKKRYNENRHRYFTLQKIFTLLIESGAGIYGGFIRDYLLHKYGSSSFYYFMINKSSYLCENIPLFYCNEKFHPESYQNRNTISVDIDTVMNMKRFEYFVSTLDSFNIKYSYTIFNNFKKYINIIDNQDQISKYIIFKIFIDNPFDINNLETFSNFKSVGNNISFKKYETSVILIDILICNDDVSVKDTLENITSNSDFYCNSLYILYDKLSISESISKKIKVFSFGIDTLYQDDIRRNLDIFLKKNIYTSEVIEIVKKQIFERKAVCLNLSQKKEYRMTKIKSKGFTILVNHNIFEYISCKDEICLLCRSDTFEGGGKVIKFKCCNSFYHEECLVEYVKKIEIKKCFLCSKYIDGEMFKHIFNF